MKIAVAMSGGVDSSVTAALLKKEGHEVTGFTMRLFEPDGDVAPAMHDAPLVAAHLGIQHHFIDFETDFRKLVIDVFAESYRLGRTPNPCVRCNSHVKFGLLLENALEFGAEMLATGHYVRKTTDSAGVHHLRTSLNIRKDQSYFLCGLTQGRLSSLLFPLGEIESKEDVREIAREFRLPVSEKGESQEICFIPDDDYVAFLEKKCGLHEKPGDIIHRNGEILGRHGGIHRYTIGQRRGIGVAWSEPLYVSGIDPARNAVIVAEEQHIFSVCLAAENLSWIIPPRSDEFVAFCKIRYRHRPVGCRVRIEGEGRCQVLFDEPQRGVTPGQSVVFYRDDELLGGGVII